MAAILYSPAIDTLSNLGRSILTPVWSAPLLLAIAYYPDTIRNVITTVAQTLPGQLATGTQSTLQSMLESPATTKSLKILVTLGVVRIVNQFLNTTASNSWRMFQAPGWNWPDEIAVITGGSSGIGNAIVSRLSALGVRVAVLDVQPLPKEMVGDAHIRYYQCDVTSSSSVASAADSIRREMGHPTILINNAGVAQPTPILKTDEAFLRRIMGVNLMSLWFTTQQFLPHMIQRDKGHVVTVASIASFVALATAADYSATKAGALAFHESLASEIKHQYKAPNVLTSIIHPNFVKTPLLSDFSGRLERAGVRMLTSDVVADAVIAQIKGKMGGQLVVPRSATGVSGIRGWPTWVQEVLRDTIARGAVKP